MSAAGEPAQAEVSPYATLRSATVSADASRIELTSDKPFTYTSYKAGEPVKIVVDISQTVPGSVASPIEVNRGNVRRIDLVRQPLGGGVLTRVEVTLAKDADFSVATDPADKSRLVIALAPAEPQAPLAAEIKEAPLAEARIEEKTLAPESAVAAPTAEPLKTEPAKTEPPQAPAQTDPAPAPAALSSSATPAAVVAAVSAPAAATETTGDNPSSARKSSSPSSVPRLTAVLVTGDGVELSLDGAVQTFNSFKLTKPDRLVLDLFGAKSAVAKSLVPIGAFGIANARVGSTPDKVRVVLDAEQSLPPLEVVPSALGLKIRPKGAASAAPRPSAAAAAAAVAPVPAPAPAIAPVPAVSAAREVPAVAAPPAVKAEVPAPPQSKGALEALDFEVVEGVSRITMKLHGTCEPAHPVPGMQGLSLTIKNCEVPKPLQRTLDTSKFGSPVLSVTPYQVKVKGAPVTKLLVRLRGNPPYTMNRKGDVVVWDITNPGPLSTPKLPPAPATPPPPVAAALVKKSAAPKVAEEVAAPRADEMMTEIPISEASRLAPKKVYKGRRVTLEFSDADIRKIFQLIAEVSNLNFLIADDVSGTITIKLVNVPWDQALDVILDAKGLGMVREGNIVQIKPKAKIQTQADEEQAAKRAAERAMELRTAVFEVNYAAVGEVAGQFTALKSERGTITRDERTSRVIVKDIQPALDDMRILLRTLDAPEKQVMIEARIVEATSTFTRDLGVQWGLSYRDGSASVLGLNSVETGFGGVVSTAGPGSSGAGGLGLGMSFGKLTSNVQLDLRLAAAATIGQVKIISTPKVVTLNNKAAKISQGQSIPYQTTSAEGTKTEFVEAALTLEVTPHITADGSVSMKIKASNNSPGTGSPPPINKKEATTELVVANGETTVIGGIYVDSDTESDTGVPFLADIPLLGWLFKSNAKQKTKTELLIFITPKLIL